MVPDGQTTTMVLQVGLGVRFNLSFLDNRGVLWMFPTLSTNKRKSLNFGRHILVFLILLSSFTLWWFSLIISRFLPGSLLRLDTVLTIP